MTTAKQRPWPAVDQLTTLMLQGIMGDFVLRPWFDRVALPSVARVYMPLSRAWIEALATEGEVEALPESRISFGPSRSLLQPVLKGLQRRHQTYREAEQQWQSAFLGEQQADDSTLAATERNRHAAAHRHMSGRAAMLPWLRCFPPVRWAVASPAEVQTKHGARLADPQTAFAADALPTVVETNGFDREDRRHHWLRFPSAVIGDQAWAHVETPRGEANPPTLIFLHGVAMETEMWRGSGDTLLSGVGEGLRIIRPEGPWHGRRALPGWFGGEPVFGAGPMGLLDLFHAWLRELAVLVAWARQTSTGPVAIGGVSLGALTSQLAVGAAASWPAALRPDAALLVATTGDVLGLEENSSLTQAVDLAPQLAGQGWNPETLARYEPLMAPGAIPGLPPERIVMVLGQSDDVTDHAGGLALAKRWKVPENNLFIRPQGHFSVSLGLIRQPAPLHRLAEILA